MFGPFECVSCAVSCFSSSLIFLKGCVYKMWTKYLALQWREIECWVISVSMTVFKWNVKDGGNKLIFHTAKLQVHRLTKLCFYYTSASEGRRGGTGTKQHWSYTQPGMISAHLHSHLKVQYTLFHQKEHAVTFMNSNAKHWIVFSFHLIKQCWILLH